MQSNYLNARVMIWTPHVTVAAVMEQDGRFLLVRERVSGRSMLNQPAGHLEDGESLIAAVIRETLEETGWRFQPEAVIGMYRWRHPHKGITYLRVTFSGCGLSHDAGRPLDEGIEDTLWMSLAEIRRQPEMVRSPLVLKSIEDYLAGARYPLSVLADID
jgi:8-oxo-dGTP pyrophosphatase MutT (NUDIX family)